MGEPLFRLQIVDGKGVIATLPGGGSLERDLIAMCTDAILSHGAGEIGATCALALREGLDTAIDQCVAAIVSRGVGFLKTEAHVRQAVRDGLREVLLTQALVTKHMRHQVAAIWDADEVRTIVAAGIASAIQTLKDHTKQVV